MAKKSKANRVVGIMPATERKWQAEDDLRTLVRAAEIRKDPKRFKAAQAAAKEQLASIAAVAKAEKK